VERSNQGSVFPGPDPGLTPSIEALIEAWTGTWNAHDMHAAAALVEADVDFVTVAGRWLRGRDEFLRHHHDIHRLQMRETTWVTLGYEIRRLRADLALAHLEWTITGERDADGWPRPQRPGIFTWLIACTRGRWLIAAAHNTNLRADTSHRLAGRGTS
jgi:uncharacterized protein (TIGR02246 family)